jgi:hypothetical protein
VCGLTWINQSVSVVAACLVIAHDNKARFKGK